MGKIYIATCAYNAEKTIKRCIESVLNQTYADFVYYICDNASTDQTGEMIGYYASVDNRIVPSHNKVNHDWHDNLNYALLPHNISNEDYFCLLDADDELESSFFEEMLNFLKKNNLDIAVCGNVFIDIDSGEYKGSRTLAKELILKNADDFSEYFRFYHQFMRTGWAKLYTGNIAHQRFAYSDYPENFPRAYGGDTYIIFHCLRYANRVGIYPKNLYKYYVSNNSRSYQMKPQRIACDRILFADCLDFLCTKCGSVSPRNEDFLYAVYLNAVKDTVKVLLDAKISVSEKLHYIHDIFTHEYTRKLASIPDLGELNGLDIKEVKSQFFGSVVKWMLSQDKTHSGDYFTYAVDVLAAMRACPSDIPGWSSRGKLDLLIALREKLLAESSPTHTVDMHIESMFDTSPLLKKLPVAHAGFLKSVVLPVLSEDYPAAIDALFVLAEDGEIPDGYAESYIALGQNVCAAAEYGDGWVFFKKLWINYLYEHSRLDEVRAVLTELTELLPEDEDLQAMWQQL